MRVLGAASIAAIALVACAKKEDTTAVEDTATAEETAAVEADAAEATATEPADVYAAPTVDLASVRTKDDLNAVADSAFGQADADADGAISQTEFYTLASMLTPVAETTAVESPDAGDAAVDATAETAPETADVAAEEPAADVTGSLDASYAALAGADATLTADDLRAALLARFDAADANLDGALDDAEAATFNTAKLF
jgi:hypothetical protein